MKNLENFGLRRGAQGFLMLAAGVLEGCSGGCSAVSDYIEKKKGNFRAALTDGPVSCEYYPAAFSVPVDSIPEIVREGCKEAIRENWRMEVHEEGTFDIENHDGKSCRLMIFDGVRFLEYEDETLPGSVNTPKVFALSSDGMVTSGGCYIRWDFDEDEVVAVVEEVQASAEAAERAWNGFNWSVFAD